MSSEKLFTIIEDLQHSCQPPPPPNFLEKLLEEYLDGCDDYHVVYITHENEYPESPLQQNILKTRKTVAVGLIGLAAKFQNIHRDPKMLCTSAFLPQGTHNKNNHFLNTGLDGNCY